MSDVDVIIAGCGPTGATLAGLLGQRGMSVAVFGRLPDLFPLPRAAGLATADYPEHEPWPLLQRWLRSGEGRIWCAAAYRFHGLVAREWRRDRILLAGDSAHMTPKSPSLLSRKRCAARSQAQRLKFNSVCRYFTVPDTVQAPEIRNQENQPGCHVAGHATQPLGAPWIVAARIGTGPLKNAPSTTGDTTP